jgi:toxin CcdB
LRQFDVVENRSPLSRKMAPFLVVLQSHLLDAMPTVVVAPMLARRPTAPYTKTSVTVAFHGDVYVVSIAELAAVEVKRLGPTVGSLRESEDEIRHALTFVFVGV